METKSKNPGKITALTVWFSKYEKRILKILWVAFGFFSAAPMFSLKGITFFTWGVLGVGFVSAIRLLRDQEIRFSRLFDWEYLVYITVMLVSYFVCYERMSSTWNGGILKSFIQLACFGLTCLMLQSEESTDEMMAFIEGLYYAAVIQMLWGLMQFVLYKVGIDLNNIVFANILHLIDGGATQLVGNGGIKMSGFCWNSGNFAPLMVIGFWLAKKKYMRYLFVLTALLSGSRTLIFGMGFCVTLQFLLWLIYNREVNRYTFLYGILVAVTVCVVVVLKWDYISEKLGQMSAYLNVFQNYSTEGSTNAHLNYLLTIPAITKENQLLTNLIGYGPGCSGYAITKYSGQYANLGAWVVECDYVNTLWSYGYLGFITYYFWYIRSMLRGISLNRNYLVLYATFLIMGFMYNVTFFWALYFLVFVAMLNRAGVDLLYEERIGERFVRNHSTRAKLSS